MDSAAPMLALHSSKLKVTGVATAISLAAATVGAFNYRAEQQHLSRHLIEEAMTISNTFEEEDLATLTGTPADKGTRGYELVKKRLQRLRAVDDRVRYVYLFRTHGPGRNVVFLADSATPGDPDESGPGDDYPEAAESPGLQEIIQTRRPSFEGPLRDSFGVWVTGYAVVGSGNQNAPTLEIVGIDMAAGDWSRALWLAALRGTGYTLLLLGFPVFAIVASRKHGEQRDAIRNLSEAVEQSHSAIMIIDLDHRIEYVNRGLCRQMGYSRRELIGRQWRDFLPDSLEDGISELVRTVRSGRTWEGEWTNVRKDGAPYPVHGMVTPVTHRDGVMACFVANFDDVSELKRKEAELREARDLAQAGDRAKGQFLATMSHEVRTPLNGIVGFTSLLLDTQLTDEQREFVQTIRASGEALIQLTGDILDYARIESGKLKLDAIACDPRECIEEALDLHAARAAEKDIPLLHRTTSDVPAAVVVDGGRLRQVLVNLVGNAVKFTDRGRVDVSVRVTETIPSPPGDSESPLGSCVLEFSIRDTGIGIPPEQHGRLFKPFSQIDESLTRRYGGAGLGLAICKNLVELMGGAISVSSRSGHGTTFVFTIRVPVAAPPPPRDQLAGLRIGVAMSPGAPREELVDLLTSWGASVTQARSPDELAGGGWDLAVADVSRELAEEIASGGRSFPGLMQQRTVALVPISLPSGLRTALRAHFRLLVNRPIHHGAFFGMLSGTRPAREGSVETATQFGLRVLVVEDNPVNQRLLQRVLEGLGCTWKVVGNGLDAIAELKEHAGETDVVLLDLHMPGMDGLSALERIRLGEAGPAARTLWIIALTADVRPEQRAKGVALGLDDYLTKPLRLAELEASLQRFRSERMARKG